MVALKFVSALALASAVIAKDDDACKDDFQISGANDVPSCKKVDGSITISADGAIDLGKIEEITGDLKLNQTDIPSLTSSKLSKIGGTFHIKSCNNLRDISLTSLTEVDVLEWVTVNGLSNVQLGPLEKANTVHISDTYLSSWDAFSSIEDIDNLQVDNNHRLSQMSSKLKTIKKTASVSANGIRNLEVEFPNLIWATELDFSNVSKISIDKLETVNNSLKFGYNYFEEFKAPNLTKTGNGDISIISNAVLANLSFPALTDVGGAVIVANNTNLDKITAFPALETVRGSIAIRGNFTEFSFPELNNVEGTADVTSTNDIDDACDEFNKKAPSSQGGNGDIQGEVDCTSNNEHANNSTDSSSTGGGSSSSSSGKNGKDSSDDEDKDGAAGALSANTASVFGFTLLAGLVATML